jgi:predicted lipoprotein with Yx(FWY)xxD motif
MRKLLLSLAGGLFLAASGVVLSAPATTVEGALVGANGMTLYTFDRDAAGSGKSVCNGACATLWPPSLASDADQPSGDFTVVVRDDGKKQWAYKGKPLYYFSRDSKAGEITGDGFNQVWKTARP